MTPEAVDVCIIGGGLAGLAAACALRQTGASVVVLERRTELGDPHRGDWLRPSSVALLKQWGVNFERRQPIEIHSIEVEIGPKLIARRKLKEPGLCLPQAQLEALLRETAKAAGVELRLGWQLQSLSYSANQDRVAGVTAVSGIHGAAFVAKLVIAADGRSSPIRDALGLRFKPQEKTNELVALEADLAGGSAAIPSRVVFSIGKNGGGFATPISARRVRVVAATGISEADALARKAPADLAQELPARSPLPLGSVIDPARVRGYEQTNPGHASNYATKGAVCIGDAAHPPPAPSGEGMQMTVLDVEALSRLVGPALKAGERAIDKALIKFETERWPDNERRLKRARQAVRWLQPLSGGKQFFAKTFGKATLSSLLAVD